MLLILLNIRRRTFSCVNAPMLDGIGPTIPLKPKSRYVNDDIELMEDGIDPKILFFPIASLFMPTKNPISVGNVPDIPTLLKSISITLA